MSADGNQRSGSSGRSYTPGGSYGNSNYDTNLNGSGYSRHGNGRYQSEGWSGNGYSSYKRYDRASSGSSSYSSNNQSLSQKNPNQGLNDRSNRNFGTTYSSGSSYVPGRKWSSSYQPGRSDSSSYAYNKSSSYKGTPTSSVTQQPSQSPTESQPQSDHPTSSQSVPKSQLQYQSSQTSSHNQTQLPYSQRPPKRSNYRPDHHSNTGNPNEISVNNATSGSSNYPRSNLYGSRSSSSISYDYPPTSKPQASMKDKADLFAHKWNVSYPNEARGYDRDFQYEEDPYADRGEMSYRGYHEPLNRQRSDDHFHDRGNGSKALSFSSTNKYNNEPYNKPYEKQPEKSSEPLSKLPKKQSEKPEDSIPFGPSVKDAEKSTQVEKIAAKVERNTKETPTLTSTSTTSNDFKDDYDDAADEELQSELLNHQTKLQQKVPCSENDDRKSLLKKEAIMDRIPLTLEHKDELDQESTDVSSDATASPSATDLNKLEPSAEAKPQEIIQSALDSKAEDEDEGVPMEGADVVPKGSADKKEENGSKGDLKNNEDSDNYDPEMDISSKEIEQDKDHVKKEKNKPARIVPLVEIEACIFPLPRLEDKLWELKNHPRDQILLKLPYLLRKPIKSIKQYQFVDNNELVHKQSIKPRLLTNLSSIKSETFSKKVSLLNEYKQRSSDWTNRLKFMEQQLNILYPKKDDDSASTADPDTSTQPAGESLDTKKGSQSSRRSRHGDTVRSEAEFLEILKNLEKEKEQDPLYRAEQVAAIIPDMILDPLDSQIRFQNVNNLVKDKEEWASRIRTDAIDNFTRKEHESFCEAFLQYPKRFGKISSLMGGLRTAEECVLHYYKTKKILTDYKQMVLMKKKKGRKNTKPKRGSKTKTPTTSTPTTPALVDTPVESDNEKEFNLDNFIPQEAVVADELYTESGRRHRAAAPVFEFQEKNGTVPPEVIERKRSLETANDGNGTSGESEKNENDSKKQTKKKQRVQKPKGKQTGSENTSSNPPQGQEIELPPTFAQADLQNTTGNLPPQFDQQQLNSQPLQTMSSTSTFDDSALPGTDFKGDDGKNGKPHITSYWSVKDSHLFMKLLAEYGTDWNLLAEKLKTKSPIMVRNYYQRNTETLELQKIAANAASMTSRGLMGVNISIDGASASEQKDSSPRNPPLGVFTAHTNVPSNISFNGSNSPQLPNQADMNFQSQPHLPPTFGQQQYNQQTSTAQNLPSLQMFTQTSMNKQEPISLPSVSDIGTYNPTGSLSAPKVEPLLPSTSSIANLLASSSSNVRSVPPPSLPPVKSNPFSITSLLNPSEERSSTAPPVHSTSLSSSNLLNQDSKPAARYNPLDALVAATENKEVTQSTTAEPQGHSLRGFFLQSVLQQPATQTQQLPSLGSSNASFLPSLTKPSSNSMSISNALGDTRNYYGRDAPNYMGGYNAPYSVESSERGISILNPEGPASSLVAQGDNDSNNERGSSLESNQ